MNEEQPQKTDVPTNPIDTGDSQPINMPLELASQKQKKSKNALFIAMILLVILGVLVFAGYLVVKKANSTDSKQATTSKLEPKTPEEVIKLLKDKLKTEVDTNKNIKLKDLYQKNFYVKVAYRSSSTDFLITPAFQDRTALSYKGTYPLSTSNNILTGF